MACFIIIFCMMPPRLNDLCSLFDCFILPDASKGYMALFVSLFMCHLTPLGLCDILVCILCLTLVRLYGTYFAVCLYLTPTRLDGICVACFRLTPLKAIRHLLLIFA